MTSVCFCGMHIDANCSCISSYVFETNEKIKNKPSILRTDVPSSHHKLILIEIPASGIQLTITALPLNCFCCDALTRIGCSLASCLRFSIVSRFLVREKAGRGFPLLRHDDLKNAFNRSENQHYFGLPIFLNRVADSVE